MRVRRVIYGRARRVIGEYPLNFDTGLIGSLQDRGEGDTAALVSLPIQTFGRLGIGNILRNNLKALLIRIERTGSLGKSGNDIHNNKGLANAAGDRDFELPQGSTGELTQCLVTQGIFVEEHELLILADIVASVVATKHRVLILRETYL